MKCTRCHKAFSALPIYTKARYARNPRLLSHGCPHCHFPLKIYTTATGAFTTRKPKGFKP